MPRYLNLSDLQRTKDVHNHKWEWTPGVMPEKMTRNNSAAAFKLTCGICKSKHWVLFTHLKRGLSTCCAKCKRLPTIERMQDLINKHKMLWIPSLIHKSDGSRRKYWMKCGGCNKGFWVRWSAFSQGQHTGCRSCARRNAGSSLKDPTRYYKHPIMAVWRRIRSTDAAKSSWVTFEAFKEWSFKTGFVPAGEPVLQKLNPKKPYHPDNCKWVSSKETGRNTVQIRNY